MIKTHLHRGHIPPSGAWTILKSNCILNGHLTNMVDFNTYALLLKKSAYRAIIPQKTRVKQKLYEISNNPLFDDFGHYGFMQRQERKAID